MKDLLTAAINQLLWQAYYAYATEHHRPQP